jgi:WD40 repeat protein
MPTNPRPNPYVGPRAFQTGEKLYGRDSELQQLLDLLIAERIVLLYSPSGAGKSSLVQAGLVPCLQAESFHVMPIARVNLEPPAGLQSGPDFNRYVFSALVSLEEALPEDQQMPLQDLAGLTLDAYLSRRPRAEDEPNTEVLIFDQFEEILTLEPMDRAGKTVFFAQVGAALRNRPNELGRKRWALFSMREDYVPSLDPFLRPIPTRLANTFRLDLLGVEPSRQAIQNPVREAGVEMTSPAARKLIDDLRRVQVQRPDGLMEEQLGLYVEPVQLQVVCYRLWQQLDPDQVEITETDLASVGDVDESLAEYYAERVAATAGETGVRERAIRDWFDRQLITEQGIRGQVLMEPDKSEGLDNGERITLAAIRLLENAHLVRAEKRRGATWFELAHDRLLKPVRINNAAWAQAHLSLLQRQATLWDNQERVDNLVLRDEQLLEVEEWAAAHPGELTETDQEFLKKSQEARAREEEARSAAERQLKLEAAEKLAQAERRRAEEQTLHASQLRRRAVALVFLLVVALGMAGVAGYYWNVSNRTAERQTILALEKAALAEERARLAATSQENEKVAIAKSNAAATAEADAENQRGTAEAERAIADAARQDAVGERDNADNQRKRALSNSLALLSAEYLDQQSDLALLLGIESYRWNEGSWQAVNAILNGLGRTFGRKAQRYEGQPIPTQLFSVQRLSFSPDGKRLAWVGTGGSVVVSDLQPGGTVTNWQVPSRKTVNALAFNRRGNTLVTGDSDGKLIVWDAVTGRRKQTYNTALSQILDVAFSPNDTTLAVSGTSRSVYLWDINEGYKGSLSVSGYGPCAVAWAPTGNYLAVGCADRNIRIWNPVSGLEEKLLQGHEGPILSLAWSPNGRWLVSAGEDLVRPVDKALLLWNLEKNTLTPLSSHLEKVLSVAFSPDSKTLASGSADRTVILWDTNGFVPIDQLTDYGNWVNSLAFSPQGEPLLATVSYDRKIQLHKVVPQESLYQPVTFGKGKVLGLAFKPGDEVRLAASRPDRVTFWEKPLLEDTETRRNDIAGKFTSLAFHPDGERIALGGALGEVQILDFATGAVRSQFEAHQGPILGMAFHPFDDLLAISVCKDPEQNSDLCASNEIQFWDIKGAQPEAVWITMTQHSDSILSLAFSLDGQTLASGGEDRDIWLYNGSFTGRPPQVEATLLTRHTSAVSSLAFSPSGELLAIGGQDGKLALWAVMALQKIGDPFAGSGAALTGLAFHPDGKTLISGSEDGFVLQWELDPQPEPPGVERVSPGGAVPEDVRRKSVSSDQ